MDKKFDVDVWKLIDKEVLDKLLERNLAEDENSSIKGTPSDISYYCITITRDGILTLDSNFELEE